MSQNRPSKYEDTERIGAVAEFSRGDIVQWRRDCGVYAFSGCDLLIEDISLDHTHGAFEHPDKCYTPENISYSVVAVNSDGHFCGRDRLHSRNFTFKRTPSIGEVIFQGKGGGVLQDKFCGDPLWRVDYHDKTMQHFENLYKAVEAARWE